MSETVYFLALARTIVDHPFLAEMTTHMGREKINAALVSSGLPPMFEIRPAASVVDEFIRSL